MLFCCALGAVFSRGAGGGAPEAGVFVAAGSHNLRRCASTLLGSLLPLLAGLRFAISMPSGRCRRRRWHATLLKACKPPSCKPPLAPSSSSKNANGKAGSHQSGRGSAICRGRLAGVSAAMRPPAGSHQQDSRQSHTRFQRRRAPGSVRLESPALISARSASRRRRCPTLSRRRPTFGCSATGCEPSRSRSRSAVASSRSAR